MRIEFQRELAELQSKLVEISELVHGLITDATLAFRNTDVDLADDVMERGDGVEAECTALDQTAVDILARQSPVASDLRLVVSALRMSSSLERMSDLSLHIASLARYRFPERAIPKGLKRVFTEMGEYNVEISGLLTELLKTEEPSLVEAIDRVDDKIDALHVRVFEKVLSGKLDADSTAIVDATLASRYHERFGDHAVSIARRLGEFLEGQPASNE